MTVSISMASPHFRARLNRLLLYTFLGCRLGRFANVSATGARSPHNNGNATEAL